MDGRGDLTETPLSSIKNAFNAEKVALVIFIQTLIFTFLALTATVSFCFWGEEHIQMIIA